MFQGRVSVNRTVCSEGRRRPVRGQEPRLVWGHGSGSRSGPAWPPVELATLGTGLQPPVERRGRSACLLGDSRRRRIKSSLKQWKDKVFQYSGQSPVTPQPLAALGWDERRWGSGEKGTAFSAVRFVFSPWPGLPACRTRRSPCAMWTPPSSWGRWASWSQAVSAPPPLPRAVCHAPSLLRPG